MPILLGNKPKPKQNLPLVPLKEGVIFPQAEAVLAFGRKRSIRAIESALKTSRLVVFVTQKDPVISEPTKADFYSIGTVARVERVLRTNGDLNALVKGLFRVKIERINEDDFIRADLIQVPDVVSDDEETKALTKHLQNQVKNLINAGKNVDFPILMRLMSVLDPIELTNQVASLLDLETKQRQALLEEAVVKKRLEKIIQLIDHELKVLEIEKSIVFKTQKKFDKSFRKTVLKERLKMIQKELGDQDGDGKEIKELRQKIKQAKMSPEAEEKALKELNRLKRLSIHSPEMGYIRTYLDWLIDLPWSQRTANNIKIRNAQKVLEADHYALEQVKERILEYLAVMQLKKKAGKKAGSAHQAVPTILCFVGPPGVGKTSIGRSIARALGREFAKISLGGIRDEAEIRGHRRTYIGAMPGRIIQGIKNTKTKNPVFMLDEIDKVGTDFRGDPSAALLEALDPEQNQQFSDHYLEVPFDLSEVMFITTANVLDTIPPALKDRLEIIRFTGYTEDEKFKIAKKYLLAKTLTGAGLKKANLSLPDRTLKEIIRRYTREAGVRNLEREIAKVMRKVARQLAEGKRAKKSVSLKALVGFLGPARFSATIAEKKEEPGLVTGLAWTQVGGDILFIEVALMPGKGNLILTGKLGEVMKESCKAALSYVRSRWEKLGLAKNFASKLDFHIHVPEGAVPKDGPSAGIAIATALISALTKTKVKQTIGMTGEITLRGRILEIGGIKEKVIAAHRAGLKTVILPKDNQKDLIDVPKEVKADLDFKFVDHMDQVLKLINLSSRK